MAGWNAEKKQALVDTIEKKQGSDEKKLVAICEEIIKGGYTVVDEDGKLNENFSIGQFQAAVKKIEEGIQNTEGVSLPNDEGIRQSFFRN